MLSKIRSILISLFLLGGLELLTFKTDYYWWIFGVFALLTVLGTSFVVRRNFPEGDWTVSILPIFYFIGVILIHLFIFRGLYQHIFIITATLVFYYLITKGIHWAFPTWNWFFTYLTFFLIAAGAYGLFFHIYFSFFLVSIIISLSTFFLTIQLLRRADISERTQVLYSLILTLIIFELLWLLSFWPSTYLIIGGVLFIIYYTAVEIINQDIYQKLTRKTVASYLTFAVIAILLILGTSEWLV